MELHNHSLATLFEQLGLASSQQEIESFIHRHSNELNRASELHQADFWNVGQATFLKEAKEDDANWAEVVDQLDALLRASHH
ncbi:DUF2789 domain-containing protein [Vibrio rumoiensis]|uniref:DUF2789 domain-containing protein n=1 Tax=Vibrio rumoiensis 1S-45 TaxID=1188252 RepID=A0A1E5E4E1_9VIBR|nr:DUF2789 domain-containing protein [Vibrio rumoiensis]OEF27626.1 hypothetical protein A1QC_06225 [Vibrio rumoiensis 1S-45]